MNTLYKREILDPAAKYLSPEEVQRVLNIDMNDADICPEFLGFTEIYEMLAQIIPLHFTIIDFGAAYCAQGVFFKNHKKYIAVEPEAVGFTFENMQLFKMTTEEYIKNHFDENDVEKTFAICSYVPNWYGQNSRDLVKQYYKNVFTYYPSLPKSNNTILPSLNKSKGAI